MLYCLCTLLVQPIVQWERTAILLLGDVTNDKIDNSLLEHSSNIILDKSINIDTDLPALLKMDIESDDDDGDTIMITNTNDDPNDDDVDDNDDDEETIANFKKRSMEQGQKINYVRYNDMINAIYCQ